MIDNTYTAGARKSDVSEEPTSSSSERYDSEFVQQEQPTTKSSFRLVPEASMQARLAKVRAARNPLLEAAQPLLRALADLPSQLTSEEIEKFHRLLSSEVASFQSLCNNAQVRHEHAVGASYALCTAIDEAAHSTGWGGAAGDGAGVWAGRQLAVAFHDDARGGDKVFLLIGRLVASADEHIDLLEVLYFILGLGFEGRYATAGSGRRQIEIIRHRIFTLLNAARPEVANALSPHWQGVAARRFKRQFVIPPWFTALLAASVLLTLLVFYKYRLQRLQTQVVDRIAAISKIQPEVLDLIPSPAARSLRLKELLAAEIGRGTVGVEEDSLQSVVTFRGDEMFSAGQSRLTPRIVPILAKVAAELAQVGGTVTVVGHTDNRPIKTNLIPNNQALSEQRAAAVLAVLEAEGVERARLKSVGRADTQPLVDNATAVGRARNRRVELVVVHSASRPRPPLKPAPNVVAVPANVTP